MKVMVVFCWLFLGAYLVKAQDLYVFEGSSVTFPGKIDVYYPKVSLSEDLCVKLALFDMIYTKKIDSSTRKVMSSTEIIKPDLYYSIRKLADYYCKCLKKGQMVRENAESELKSILDKCIQIASKDTAPIEAELRAANNPEEIVGVFNKIVIK